MRNIIFLFCQLKITINTSTSLEKIFLLTPQQRIPCVLFPLAVLLTALSLHEPFHFWGLIFQRKIYDFQIIRFNATWIPKLIICLQSYKSLNLLTPRFPSLISQTSIVPYSESKLTKSLTIQWTAPVVSWAMPLLSWYSNFFQLCHKSFSLSFHYACSFVSLRDWTAGLYPRTDCWVVIKGVNLDF